MTELVRIPAFIAISALVGFSVACSAGSIGKGSSDGSASPPVAGAGGGSAGAAGGADGGAAGQAGGAGSGGRAAGGEAGGSVGGAGGSATGGISGGGGLAAYTAWPFDSAEAKRRQADVAAA